MHALKTTVYFEECIDPIFYLLFFRGIQIVSDKNILYGDIVQNHEAIKQKHMDVMIMSATVKAGLEHIVEKLFSVKLPEKALTPKPASPEEYMEELFDYAEQKIKFLLSKLQGKDVSSFREKMLTEEVSI